MGTMQINRPIHSERDASHIAISITLMLNLRLTVNGLLEAGILAAGVTVVVQWLKIEADYKISYNTMFTNMPVTFANLGGMPSARPPKGPDSFVSTYKIFEV